MQLMIEGQVVEVVKGEKKNYVKVDDRGEFEYRSIALPKNVMVKEGDKGLLIFDAFYCGAGQYGVYMGARSLIVLDPKNHPLKGGE